MRNVLVRKLEQFAPLPEDDRRLIDAVLRTSRSVPPRTDLIQEGDASKDVRLVVEGFACRYKTLRDGSRQIVAYLVPGDFCDLNVVILKSMDHSIATLSRCKVVDIPRHRIVEMTERPAIARAFWWVTLVDEATLREWLLNIGQRPAIPRIAHLLCEVLIRLRSVGLADSDAYELPLTQAEIADTVGMSYVHVNRCIQTLRDTGMVDMRLRNVVISDLGGLMEFAGFDPGYLHLGDAPAVRGASPVGNGP